MLAFFIHQLTFHSSAFFCVLAKVTLNGIADFHLHSDLRLVLLSMLLSVSISIFKNREFCSYSWNIPYSLTLTLAIFLFFLYCTFTFSCFTTFLAAYCDPGNYYTPPLIPRGIAAQPAPPPVPQPIPIIPELNPPLLSYDSRSQILYQRYLFLNWGRDDDLIRMVAIIRAQLRVEQYVEAALVDDGFDPRSISYRYRDIRGLIHSPQGELLSPPTYEAYIRQIQSHGTRSSVPYRRVRRAIHNYDLLLERI